MTIICSNCIKPRIKTTHCSILGKYINFSVKTKITENPPIIFNIRIIGKLLILLIESGNKGTLKPFFKPFFKLIQLKKYLYFMFGCS